MDLPHLAKLVLFLLTGLSAFVSIFCFRFFIVKGVTTKQEATE
jgi:hypothetical protein